MRKKIDRKQKLESKINEVLYPNRPTTKSMSESKMPKNIKEAFMKTAMVNTETTNLILEAVEVFEEDNLATIAKFKKKKQIETKRISGALKQTINSHGPITKVLIGSATKRIYGSLLSNETDKEIEKDKNGKKFSIKSIIIGIIMGVGMSLLLF